MEHAQERQGSLPPRIPRQESSGYDIVPTANKTATHSHASHDNASATSDDDVDFAEVTGLLSSAAKAIQLERAKNTRLVEHNNRLRSCLAEVVEQCARDRRAVGGAPKGHTATATKSDHLRSFLHERVGVWEGVLHDTHSTQDAHGEGLAGGQSRSNDPQRCPSTAASEAVSVTREESKVSKAGAPKEQTDGHEQRGHSRCTPHAREKANSHEPRQPTPRTYSSGSAVWGKGVRLYNNTPSRCPTVAIPSTLTTTSNTTTPASHRATSSSPVAAEQKETAGRCGATCDNLTTVRTPHASPSARLHTISYDTDKKLNSQQEQQRCDMHDAQRVARDETQMMITRLRRSLAPVPSKSQVGDVIDSMVDALRKDIKQNMCDQLAETGRDFELRRIAPCAYKLIIYTVTTYSSLGSIHINNTLPVHTGKERDKHSWASNNAQSIRTMSHRNYNNAREYKLHLSIDSGRLTVIAGGGHVDILEYLERKLHRKLTT